MTPEELQAIRERAVTPVLGKPIARALDQAISDRRTLLDHVDELQHRIDQVLDLHHERNHRPLDGTHLGGTICDHCRRPWPCPTIQAIDGDL